MKRIFLSLAILGSVLFTSCEENSDKTIPTEVKSMLDKGIVDTTLTIVTEDYTYTFKDKELVSKVSNDKNDGVKAVLFFILVFCIIF